MESADSTIESQQEDFSNLIDQIHQETLSFLEAKEKSEDAPEWINDFFKTGKLIGVSVS